MKPAVLNLSIVQGTTFGPVVITCRDSDGNLVDLTEWNVWADARESLGSPVAFSLAPQITNEVGGQITLARTDEQTKTLPAGSFQYDLILENPSGERLPPIVAGTVTVSMTYTRPA